MMLLKGSLSHGRLLVIRINGVSLRYKIIVGYLGISIDGRMSFLHHFERVKEKLLNAR